MVEPSPARRGLDALLARFPTYDLLALDWDPGRPMPGRRAGDLNVNPWLIVDLGQRSDGGTEAWAASKFAIWKSTGAVHTLGADGAVSDDPILTPS
jgi:hypothetical protein